MPPSINKQSPRHIGSSGKPSVPVKKAEGTKVGGSSGSVLDRIQAIDFTDNTGIKCILYGQSGTGKTTLWATFPGPILSIICSGSVKSGELRSVNTAEYRKKIKTVTLENSREILEIVDYINSSDVIYETVVLDHVSGLQDQTLKEVLGVDTLPAQKSWGMASQQHYGQSTLQTKELLKALLNLSCNVVIIGQERLFNGREDGVNSELLTPTVGIAVTPSLAGWLNPTCDYVLQTFKRPKLEEVVTTINNKRHVTHKRGQGVEYCLRCEPHDVYMTKFRVPKGSVLPSVIVDPSYDKLMSVINGEGKD